MQCDPTFFAFLIAVLRIRILLVTLTRIWIRVLLVTVMRIWILLFPWRGSGSYLSLWCGSGSLIPTLNKCSNPLIFHTFWLVTCKLMRILIRIQPITLMRIRIQLITLIRIRILPFQFDPDLDPQHCFIGLHIIPVATASLQQYKKKFSTETFRKHYRIKAHRFLDCLVLDFYFHILFAKLELVCCVWRWWTNILTRELRNSSPAFYSSMR